MTRVKDLSDRLAESQGMKSDKRIVVLENIFDEAQVIEKAAFKDPFSVPLEEIRDLRVFLSDLETAMSRARAGIKRSEDYREDAAHTR